MLADGTPGLTSIRGTAPVLMHHPQPVKQQDDSLSLGRNSNPGDTASGTSVHTSRPSCQPDSSADCCHISCLSFTPHLSCSCIVEEELPCPVCSSHLTTCLIMLGSYLKSPILYVSFSIVSYNAFVINLKCTSECPCPASNIWTGSSMFLLFLCSL